MKTRTLFVIILFASVASNSILANHSSTVIHVEKILNHKGLISAQSFKLIPENQDPQIINYDLTAKIDTTHDILHFFRYGLSLNSICIFNSNRFLNYELTTEKLPEFLSDTYAIANNRKKLTGIHTNFQ